MNLSIAWQWVSKSYKAWENEIWFHLTPQLEKPNDVLLTICITKGLYILFTGFKSINNEITSAISSTLQCALNDVGGWYNLPKRIEALNNGTLIGNTDQILENNSGDTL